MRLEMVEILLATRKPCEDKTLAPEHTVQGVMQEDQGCAGGEDEHIGPGVGTGVRLRLSASVPGQSQDWRYQAGDGEIPHPTLGVSVLPIWAGHGCLGGTG